MQRLPDSWVKAIFSKLTGRFGTSFTNKFASGQALPDGTDSGIANAMGVWSEDLGGLEGEQIKYALQHMDAKFPPSSLEFLEIARRAPKMIPPALPAPEIPAAKLEAHIATVEKAMHKGGGYDYKGWAKKLRAEYLSGARLYLIQISMASEALGETWEGGKCFPRQEAA